MPVDWRKIDRNLSEVYHLTPHAIDQMTLPEICLLLEDANEMRQAGNMSGQQMIEEMDRWRKKTNREKLLEAKAKNGR